MHQTLVKLFLLILVACFCCPNSYAQNPSSENDSIPPAKIEIIDTDTLIGLRVKNEEVRRLINNVVLRQDDILLECDSARFYKTRNVVEAFGNVHIQQGDSINIYSSFLYFDGNSSVAVLNQDVFMEDGKSELKADSLLYFTDTKEAILHDNVFLTDQKTQVTSDSLVYFVNPKIANLYGSVELVDSTVNVKSDSLIYNVYKREANLFGNVLFKDGEMELEADEMDYNTTTKNGEYRGNGKVFQKETTLTSDSGKYFGNKKTVTFEKNVHLQSPEYILDTEYLEYDMETENAAFSGPTTIIQDGNTIETTKGTYNRADESLQLDSRATMVNEGQILIADKFDYKKEQGFGVATGNVIWTDTTQNLTIKSKKTIFYDNDEKVEATGDVILEQIANEDTLFLSADTLLSYINVVERKDTAGITKIDSLKTLLAYENVKIFRKDMQGVCDSLAYSFTDSIFKMFREPTLWVEKSQLSADTIILATQNNEPQELEMLSNAFIAEEMEIGLYNQIKGNDIFGYFKESSIDNLIVEERAESIYYIQKEDNSFTGLNKAASKGMKIAFAEGKVSKIGFYEKPRATFYPMQNVRPKDFELKGFSWNYELKPTRDMF